MLQRRGGFADNRANHVMLEWYAKEERHLKNRRFMEQQWTNLRDDPVSGVPGAPNDTPQKVCHIFSLSLRVGGGLSSAPMCAFPLILSS